MSRAVWKFELGSSPRPQSVSMPVGAQPQHFGEQHNRLVLWALVDPDASFEDRWFRVAVTGSHIEDDAPKYIGTALTDEGVYVLHLFEVKPPQERSGT